MSESPTTDSEDNDYKGHLVDSSQTHSSNSVPQDDISLGLEEGIARSQSSRCPPQRRRRPPQHFHLDIPDIGPVLLSASMAEEVARLQRHKTEFLLSEKEPGQWKEEIRVKIEQELNQRVRDALHTPPLERIRRNQEMARQKRKLLRENTVPSLSLAECKDYSMHLPSKVSEWQDNLNAAPPFGDHVPADYRYYDWMSRRRHKRKKAVAVAGGSGQDGHERFHGYHNRSTRCSQDWGGGTEAEGAGGASAWPGGPLAAGDSASEAKGGRTSDEDQPPGGDYVLKMDTYTATGFSQAVRTGGLAQVKGLKLVREGLYQDLNGVLLSRDGPFWPPHYGPLYPKPVHIQQVPEEPEPLLSDVALSGQTIHNQRTKYSRLWNRVQVVFDSERTAKGAAPLEAPQGCCPNLMFESRFESGNLRQARRIGQFEYELVLKTDLYTNRHTQWYYFRVSRMVAGVTYKFNITNLLKRDSLYNHGMRPLLYSDRDAEENTIGWIRAGHHISYSRNYNITRNPLLFNEMTYYMLEWQMEFPQDNDTCYLAHCYPYTFTDLKEHLERVLSDPYRSQFVKKEVLCETKAGNSCFLLTITANDSEAAQKNKKGVVVSARVHPGESNSSWMMKGLLDFVTSPDPVAQELRKEFVFKIVPMLNPDGVIVGNYRCSLSGRDLNRNYRHPRKESFPTIWSIKNMLADFSGQHKVVIYCDLHGHSRKHNVFIYGCGRTKNMMDFLNDRLFPWMMSMKCPDKFSFSGCKFQIKKCKAATGRVVMWREMGINNSFTMEATFCGSKHVKSSEPPRHFTTRDFEEMGRHFCEVVMEHTRASSNKSLRSELILELTRQVTHQVLTQRGVLVPSMPKNFDTPLSESSESNSDKDEGASPSHQADQKAGTGKAETTSMTTTTGSDTSSKEQGKQTKAVKVVDGLQPGAKAGSLPKEMLVKFNSEDRQTAVDIIENLTVETIDGCVQILQQLDIFRDFAESDSSDSDSASESEMPGEEKPKKGQSKKKKKKKKRSTSVPASAIARLHSTRSAPKLRPQVLPEVSGPDAEKHKNKQHSDPSLHLNISMMSGGRMQLHTPTIKKFPPFINRYSNRSNHGIPIFSQERIEERATKRLEDMRKMVVERQQKEAAGVHMSEENNYQQLLQLTRALHLPPEEKVKYTPLNSMGHDPKANLNFKQGYTHAGPTTLRGPAPDSNEMTDPTDNGGSHRTHSDSMRANSRPHHHHYHHHHHHGLQQHHHHSSKAHRQTALEALTHYQQQGRDSIGVYANPPPLLAPQMTLSSDGLHQPPPTQRPSHSKQAGGYDPRVLEEWTNRIFPQGGHQGASPPLPSPGTGYTDVILDRLKKHNPSMMNNGSTT